MKQSEYKENLIKDIVDRVKLVWFIIVNTWYNDTAYALNNIVGMAGALIYTGIYFLFIEVIYSQTEFIAGYSKNEMFLFLFVGSVAYFVTHFFSGNTFSLINDVNSGNLDLILTKPFDALFYTTVKKISIMSWIVTGIPQFLAQAYIVNWEMIDISGVQIIAAIPIFVCGLFCFHVFQFLLALPCFWVGESTRIVGFSWLFEYNVGRTIPFEGFTSGMKVLFTTLIPVIFTTGLTVSVLLGKSDPLISVIWVAITASVAFVIKRLAWAYALKNYTSASS